MRTVFGGLIAAGLALGLVAANTTAQTATPYKLGMFEQNGRAFVGLVIQNDTLVIDLSRANVGAPPTLKQLIAGWDAKMAAQLAALAAKPSAHDSGGAAEARCRRFRIPACSSTPR